MRRPRVFVPAPEVTCTCAYFYVSAGFLGGSTLECNPNPSCPLHVVVGK